MNLHVQNEEIKKKFGMRLNVFFILPIGLSMYVTIEFCFFGFLSISPFSLHQTWHVGSSIYASSSSFSITKYPSISCIKRVITATTYKVFPPSRLV